METALLSAMRNTPNHPGPHPILAILDQEFTVGRMLLLLGLFSLITFPEIWLCSHAFAYRDAGLFTYPLAYYHKDCFWRGELPLWNPYNNCGIPFLAQWNTLVLYPPALFYLILPMPWSMNFFQLGHLFLAGWGMYELARRWFGSRFAASLAGLAFAWNGLSINSLMWSSSLAALGWMPWVVLWNERAAEKGGRTLVWASLLGALQMVTGAPEIILFTWGVAAGCVLVNAGMSKELIRQATRLAFVGVLVAGLSAVQLLPFFDLFVHGNRDASFSRNDWSIPLWGWLNFLVPLFRMETSATGNYSQPDQYWTSSYYLGIGVMALAGAAMFTWPSRRVTFLAVLAGAGMVCALGDAGYVFKALRSLFPFLNVARYPVKFIVLTAFSVPLLASAAIAYLQQSTSQASLGPLRRAAGLCAMGVGVALVAAYCFPFAGASWDKVAISGVIRLLFLGGFLLGLQRLMNAPGRSNCWILSLGLLLAQGLDICTHHSRHISTASTAVYDPFTPGMRLLPVWGDSRALLTPEVWNLVKFMASPSDEANYMLRRGELASDCNLLGKIPKVDGFYALYIQEEAQVRTLLNRPGDPWLDFLGVSETTRVSPLMTWEHRANYLPLATIGQKPLFADGETTMGRLAHTNFNPRQEVWLPPEAKAWITAPGQKEARILASDILPQECRFETESPTKAMLTLAQAYYPRWQASVDGQPVRLWRANHAFQAVEVPAGRHWVRLVYRDVPFQIGTVISGVALLGCLVTLAKNRFHPIRNPDTAAQIQDQVTT